MKVCLSQTFNAVCFRIKCLLCLESVSIFESCVLFAETMVPIAEEDILFLSEPPDDPLATRKGVTVSRIETYRNPAGEIRVAIWTFMKLAGGYITPKKGGISLTLEEYQRLMHNTAWTDTRVQNIRQEGYNNIVEGIENMDDLEALEKKVQDAKKLLAKEACPAACNSNSTQENTRGTPRRRSQK